MSELREVVERNGTNALKVAKVACLDDLLFFTRYIWKMTTQQSYIVGQHHVRIAEAMEKVYRGEITRLIIKIAPRYGKTTLVVHNGIAKGLALNPASKYIHLSYSDDLALDNSEKVRDIVKSEAYQQLFPEVQIRTGSDSKKKWYTTQGGGVYATSASGQVTGWGAGLVEKEIKEKGPDKVLEPIIEPEEKEAFDDFFDSLEKAQGFGGAIFIDDPSKPDEVHSDVIRERINNKFNSTIKNRVNSRKTPIVITMQGLHERDLGEFVQLKQPGVWTVIELPAIYYEIEEGIEKAKALWPHMHTLEELRELERVDPFTFYPQYMQDFRKASGRLFSKDQLNWFNPKTFPEELVEIKMATIDPSDTGGDDLSMPVGELVGNSIYITQVIYNTDGEEVNTPAIISLIKDKKLFKVVIESNAAWIMFRRKIANIIEEEQPETEVRAVKNTVNKHIRILSNSGFIKKHMYFRSDYQDHPQYERFMINLLGYNKVQEGVSRNIHDDAPDSLAELMQLFRSDFPDLF